MARAYGNERTANATIRLTQQEKAVIQRVAYARNMSISEVIREAIAQYCADTEMKRIYAEYLEQHRYEASAERFRIFADNYNKEARDADSSQSKDNNH